MVCSRGLTIGLLLGAGPSRIFRAAAAASSSIPLQPSPTFITTTTIFCWSCASTSSDCTLPSDDDYERAGGYFRTEERANLDAAITAEHHPSNNTHGLHTVTIRDRQSRQRDHHRVATSCPPSQGPCSLRRRRRPPAKHRTLPRLGRKSATSVSSVVGHSQDLSTGADTKEAVRFSCVVR